MKEKSLVAFTLLAQLAAGLFWTLSLVSAWAARQAGFPVTAALTRLGLPVIVLLTGSGMLAAFSHLGSPARAWRAVSNLRRSWLSREIVFAGVFGAASALLGIGEWLGQGGPAARLFLAAVAWLSSLGLVYAMANTYRLRTVPAWDTWFTPLSFFITAWLGGALACGVLLILAFPAQSAWTETALRGIAISATILLGAELALQATWLEQMHASPAALASLTRITQTHGKLFKLRLALAVAGIAATCVALVRPGANGLPGQDIAILLAFGLVLSAEIAGRLLFYEARVRQGV